MWTSVFTAPSLGGSISARADTEAGRPSPTSAEPSPRARALLAQLAPESRDPSANVRTAVELVAGHPQVDLVVFPELFLSGYTLHDLAAVATDAEGAELGKVAAAAAASRTAVLIGFVEPVARGHANSAACIDSRGRVAAVYRKLRLFGREQDVFVPGEEPVVVELAGLAVGPLVCFDVEFPEPARAAAAGGAELLVTISANMAEHEGDHERDTRARSVETRLAHLYVNRVGSESGFRFVGRSRSIGPDGAVLAEAPRGRPALLEVDVPAATPEEPAGGAARPVRH